MTVFAQDSNNDISFVGGKMSLVRNNAEQVAILLKNRLQFFLGEWFLDVREGIPYYDVVMVKNPDLNLLSRMFRKVILATEGVAQIDVLTADLDAALRKLTVTIRVLTDDGFYISGGTDTPFIVEVT